MPFQVTLDGSLIRITFAGDLTAQEWAAAAAELTRLEATLPRMPDRLSDLSGVTSSQPDFGSVFDVAKERRERVFPNAFRSAVFAPTAVALGFARMFQTLNTNEQIDLQIFGTMAEARAWLGLEDDGAAEGR